MARNFVSHLNDYELPNLDEIFPITEAAVTLFRKKRASVSALLDDEVDGTLDVSRETFGFIVQKLLPELLAVDEDKPALEANCLPSFHDLLSKRYGAISDRLLCVGKIDEIIAGTAQKVQAGSQLYFGCHRFGQNVH